VGLTAFAGDGRLDMAAGLGSAEARGVVARRDTGQVSGAAANRGAVAWHGLRSTGSGAPRMRGAQASPLHSRLLATWD
jgi:hypothetical protein